MGDESLPSVSVAFRLDGSEFDPGDVTARLGVEPTHSYRAGDSISGGIGRRRRDAWIIRVGPRETLEVDGMLDELRGRLSTASALVNETCAALGLVSAVYCAVEPTSRLTPSLQFPREFVVWAADLGAFIDIDVMLRADA